jgi:hypothetical protein
MDKIIELAIYAALSLAVICILANIIHKWASHDQQLHYLPTPRVFSWMTNGLLVVAILVFVGAVSGKAFLIAIFAYAIFQDTYSIVMRRKAVRNASQTDPALQ